jgi:hypothetical protein
VSDDPGMGPWISVVAAAAVAATSRIAVISLAVSSWVDLGGEVFAVDHLADGFVAGAADVVDDAIFGQLFQRVDQIRLAGGHQGDAEPMAAHGVERRPKPELRNACSNDTSGTLAPAYSAERF